MTVKFHIISTGWKCEDTGNKCADSVDYQTYENWRHAVFIDGFGKNAIQKYPDNKRFVLYEAERYGKMRNFYKAYLPMKDTDSIICDLDLDDYLEPDALETVARVYEEHPETLVTHGSFRMLSGRKPSFNGPYETDNFRQEKWKASHFKTFRASLFHRIKINDFKGPPDGNWLMSGADLAMMYPMLEMAGLDRIKYINKPIYVYNDLSDLNDHKTDPGLQKTVERYLRRQKPYRRI